MSREDLLEALSADGFAVTEEDLDLHQLCAELGRSGRPELLTPVDHDQARAWSLSRVYGRGAFPWHTDGAISTNPPRWVILRAVQITEPTSTELLRPDPALLSALRRTVLKARDRHDRIRYLPATVSSASGATRLRWDPRTCTPIAGITPAEVEQQPATQQVTWRPNSLLILDNTRVLHRRPAVSAQSRRALERTYVWSR